jgi:hypothetical protein
MLPGFSAPRVIPRARAAETEKKANSYQFFYRADLSFWQAT